jgi:hypothetical protein
MINRNNKTARFACHLAGFARQRVTTRLLLILLFGLAGFYLFTNASKLAEFEWRLHPGWFLWAVALVFVGIPFLRVWLWHFVLRRLGFVIPYVESFRILRLAQLAKYVPGSVWQYVGILYLTHKAGATVSTVLGSLLSDQGASFVAGAVFVSFLATAWPFPGAHAAIWLIVAASFLIGVALLYPKPLSKALNTLVSLVSDRSVPTLPNLSTGPIVLLVAFNIVFWLILGSAFFFMVRGIAYPGIPYRYALVVAPIGVMAGFLAVLVPSGVGVTEGILLVLLTQFYPTEVALAIALVFRVLNVSRDLLLGLVAVRLGERPAEIMVAKQEMDVPKCSGVL